MGARLDINFSSWDGILCFELATFCRAHELVFRNFISAAVEYFTVAYRYYRLLVNETFKTIKANITYI